MKNRSPSVQLSNKFTAAIMSVHYKRIHLCICISFLSLFFQFDAESVEHIPVPQITAAPLDAEHTLFNQILAKVVTAKGVDYKLLKHSYVRELQTYYVQLAKAQIPQQRDEKLAFYINAYNALTLQLVVHLLPQEAAAQKDWNVRTVDGFWKQYTFTLAGQTHSLDEIEHQIIRPLGDPRIHFALNCASKSCPPLRAEAYTAKKLEQQLSAQEHDFLSSDYHLRLGRKRLELNPILKWFADDFKQLGGVRRYLIDRAENKSIKQHLQQQGRISYFAYDWSLNSSSEK